MAETRTKNIYQKINAVSAAVERIPKRGHNKFHHYDYATEADILVGVRGLLLENGLTVIPTVVRRETERIKTADGDGRMKEYNFRRALVKFTIVNDEKPSEIVESEWWGEGVDALDKGYYKAYTGAQKYFLTKTFHIPTGDDPENDGNAAQAEVKGKPTVKKPTKQEGKQSVEDLRSEIWDWLLEMSGGEEAVARGKLADYSAFPQRDRETGEPVVDEKGEPVMRFTTNVHDLKIRWAQVVHHTVKDAYEKWVEEQVTAGLND